MQEINYYAIGLSFFFSIVSALFFVDMLRSGVNTWHDALHSHFDDTIRLPTGVSIKRVARFAYFIVALFFFGLLRKQTSDGIALAVAVILPFVLSIAFGIAVIVVQESFGFLRDLAFFVAFMPCRLYKESGHPSVWQFREFCAWLIVLLFVYAAFRSAFLD